MKIKTRLFITLLAIKTALLFVLLFVVSVFAQSSPQPILIPPDSTMTRDVWFWIFVGWYVFSAFVSGMPEPTPASSPWYIWAYRSFHLLSASGTSFFQNKIYWPTHPIDTSPK